MFYPKSCYNEPCYKEVVVYVDLKGPSHVDLHCLQYGKCLKILNTKVSDKMP